VKSIFASLLLMFVIAISVDSFAGGGAPPRIYSGHGSIYLASRVGLQFPPDKLSYIVQTLDFMRANQGSQFDFYNDTLGVRISPYSHLISQINVINYVSTTNEFAAYTNFNHDINLSDTSPWTSWPVMPILFLHEADHQRYGRHTCGPYADADHFGPYGAEIFYAAKLYYSSSANLSPSERQLLFSAATSRIDSRLCGNESSRTLTRRALYYGIFPNPIMTTPPLSATFGAGGLVLTSGTPNDKVTQSYLVLKMRTDGELVLADLFGGFLWSSNTGGRNCASNCIAAFQTDGNLVLYQNGVAYWASHTYVPSGSLTMSMDYPYLQIRTPQNFKMWSATDMAFIRGQMLLQAGQITRAPGMALVYRTDGELVFQNDQGGVYWSTGLGGGRSCTAATCVAAFQTDGNLVLYQNGIPYWASNTANSGNLLRVTNRYWPYLEIY
jgi:hypothetical protein